MKMKNKRILCTIKLSRHNQLLHHLHHRNLVKCEKFGSQTAVCFHLSHGCASAPAADGWRHWFLDPPFRNTISEKCNEEFFFFYLEDGMTGLHPHGGYAESYWGMCLDEQTFKLGKGLISFCRFVFHFKAISQKCIKGITHQLKHDLDQPWKSQHECLLTRHLWRLASIDWLQIARLRWTIVGQICPQSQQQHKPPGNIISANHNSFTIQFIFYIYIYHHL